MKTISAAPTSQKSEKPDTTRRKSLRSGTTARFATKGSPPTWPPRSTSTDTHRKNIKLLTLPKPFGCEAYGKTYATKIFVSYYEKRDGHSKRLGLALLPKRFRCYNCDNIYVSEQALIRHLGTIVIVREPNTSRGTAVSECSYVISTSRPSPTQALARATKPSPPRAAPPSSPKAPCPRRGRP